MSLSFCLKSIRMGLPTLIRLFGSIFPHFQYEKEDTGKLGESFKI